MVVINGLKFACKQCIKGHRSSSCKHEDRPLFEIQKRGRPITQCAHCRELRKTKKLHIKCLCATSGQCSVGNLISKKGNKAGFGVADILNPCDCSKNSHCRCCETICSVPSTPYCRPKPPIAPKIAVELANVPDMPLPVSAKAGSGCCTPNPPISPIAVNTVLINNEASLISNGVKSSCCNSKPQIEQTSPLQGSKSPSSSSCCKSPDKIIAQEMNTISISGDLDKPKQNGCCSTKSANLPKESVPSGGCCGSSNKVNTDTNLSQHDKICQCGCQKSAIGQNPLLSVENLLNPCQCCTEGKHCICCRVPEHPTSFPIQEEQINNTELIEIPQPIQITTSLPLNIKSVDDIYSYAQNTNGAASQPCCGTLTEIEQKTDCCGDSAKVNGHDPKGCANCQVECRCAETQGKCCTTKDERKEYFDNDGVPICGCGCTIPAQECSDCVKDLCTEYILKPPSF